MTATEWLEKEIYARGPIGEDTPIWLKELYEQAKEMEKQQIIDAANLKKEDRWFDAKLYNNCGEQYFAETYGSKGSDETKGGELATFNTSSQTEISDEEIYKASIDYDNGATYETPIGHFIAGAKWYREQLKKKQ